MRKIIKAICVALWNSDIPLGPLAPYVLGGIFGRRPRRVYEPQEKMEAEG